MKRWSSILPIVAGTLLVVACIVLLCRGVQVNTSLYDLLPAGSESKATEMLQDMARASSRQVNVLVKGSSQQQVLDKARKICANLPEDVYPLADQRSMNEVAELLYPYRFQLLSRRHREALLSGETDQLRDEALSNLYSFIPLSIYSVDEDPYGFATSFLLENPILRQNGFELQDGVLLAARGDTHYAYIPLMLPLKASDTLAVLQEQMSALSELCQGEGVMLCGTPVHTWKASSSSQQAMGVLSVVSVLIILVLFIWVFASLRGMLLIALTMVAAGTVALAAAVLAHGTIHILSLVFGCSLVGICSDYIVHYLVSHHDSEDSGISGALRRSLLLGLLTSTVGYTTFYVSRVDLLGQIATLSVMGLVASMLFIFAFYPLAYRHHVPVWLRPSAQIMGEFSSRLKIPSWLPWLVAITCFTLAVWKLPVSDDLRSFYRPEPELLNAEKELAMLNNMGQGVVTLAVHGDNDEEVLSRLELVGDNLSRAGVPYFTSAAALVPSAARQQENLRLVREVAAKYEAEVPVAVPGQWTGALTPDVLISEGSPFASLSALWGKGGGLVLVPGAYADKLNELPAVPWLEVADRFAELEQQVRSWRETLIWLMLAVGVIVLILLTIFAGFRAALIICGPPAAGVLAVFGGLAACGASLTLFHVLACYLVMGLGCDYAIFRASHKAQFSQTALAVGISFVTTWSVFGVMAFTDFSVTRDMGVAISLGLTVAYVLSPAAMGVAVRRCKAACVPRK